MPNYRAAELKTIDQCESVLFVGSAIRYSVKCTKVSGKPIIKTELQKRTELMLLIIEASNVFGRVHIAVVVDGKPPLVVQLPAYLSPGFQKKTVVRLLTELVPSQKISSNLPILIQILFSGPCHSHARRNVIEIGQLDFKP